MLLKFQADDHALFAIGPATKETTSLSNFLKTAHIQTNISGMVEWLAQVNLSQRQVKIATPKATNSVTTNILIWSVDEWHALSVSMARMDTNAPAFQPSITPEQAVIVGKREVVERDWKKFVVETPVLEKSNWRIFMYRTPIVFGGHASVEISPEGKVTYFGGR
jgi:hypothetical protein